MSSPDLGFRKALLATFRLEAAEHLQTLDSGLVELENCKDTSQRHQTIETVFRSIHSLKGAARAVGRKDIEALCQPTESVFSAMKQEELALSAALFDVLHDVSTILAGLLDEKEIKPLAESNSVAELLERLKRITLGKEPVESQGRHAPFMVPALSDTVRIATVKLEKLLSRVEELQGLKVSSAERLREMREMLNDLRVMLSKTPGLSDYDNDSIRQLEKQFAALVKTGERDQRALDAMLVPLRSDLHDAMLVPISSMIEFLPAMVRDLANSRNKQVELVIHGSESEIDRRVMEVIRDPVIHLVRNCIDHGIEETDERQKSGKAPKGTVTLTVTQNRSNELELLVADDGAGLNLDDIRRAAVDSGLHSQQEVDDMDDMEALKIVFRSGISTSPLVSDLSGRGLGLSIVEEKVEALGGSVKIESSAGQGTVFKLLLPVTLTTFRGLYVRINDRRFVVPGRHAERVMRIMPGSIKSVENQQTISDNGQALAVFWLSDLLGLPRLSGIDNDTEFLQVVILSAAGQRIACVVDEVLVEQEVVVKPLGKQLCRVRNIAGATMLENGVLVPVLNVIDILQTISTRDLSQLPEKDKPSPDVKKKKSILLAEDSITSRMLLVNILQSAGYHVSAAVDGVDALSQLRTRHFDLLVSDVEMPGMDGFELTAACRSDSNLSALPVVLVTSLDTDEHRKRGVTAGANAYIVKSSFDEGNLLEVVRRML